jgi:outer membrane protein assembly factor BamA
MVVRKKHEDKAVKPSEELSEREYYLEFVDRAPRDTTEADTLDYFLDFEEDEAADSTEAAREVLEIQIDDEGVTIDTPDSHSSLSFQAGVWDEPEDEYIVEETRYAGDQFDFDMGLGYQRVDGLSIIFRQELLHHDWRVPEIYLKEIYSAKQDKWFYDVGIDQRLFASVPLYVGASVYKITDSNPMDKEIIATDENGLAAFFFKEDYRDYFTRDGSTLRARLQLPIHSTLKVEYLDDRYTSLRRRADWSVFRGSTAFRYNPPIDEGDMKSVIATYSLSTVDSDMAFPNGARVTLAAEKAGGNMGGDFDFTTVMVDARNYVKLSPYQFLRYHFKLNSRTRGTLPLQREFYVGGVGTLRGHDYKELTGDQMILGSIEYGAYAYRRAGLFVFVDSGTAWLGDGDFADQRLELDVGVGIEFIGDQTQIYAARDVKEPDSPILVGVRLNRTF